MHLAGIGAFILATGSFASAVTTTTSSSATSTTDGILAVQSPTWLPDFPVPSGVNSGYPTGAPNITDSLSRTTLNLSAYPEPWGEPSTTHPEIKAVIKAIDWSKVPKAPVRKAKSNGDLDMAGYDASKDPYCWWSDSNCVTPKVSYLPKDIYMCPNAGDWGLNYDDGPYNPSDDDKELNKYAEPELYNFLAKNKNQKATLFYIGSNVATYPEAARRALNDGHVLCVHTWSHPQMTAQTNEQVVAQLYWTLRAIKEATGITTRCWRPPYGDVDDRVRAIAWQMGMQTILWDEDTNDWNMPGDGGGNLSPSKVDGYFEGWIKSQQSGKETHGHIVLEHELNNATVKMTEKWLPKLQETFNVNTIQHCMNISQPYWETNWVYPTAANPNPVSNSSTTNSTPSSEDGTSTTITLGSTASATPAAQTPEAASSSTVNVSNNVAVNSASSKSVGAGAFLMAAAIASYLF
ncbi:glycoside hydrolase/deacetylase [Rhizopus microsporus ATCC 52813]|uniref:Glycoside hydrolase/deacetylase n=3 Tax=Rhizopus TaxID=4842 RepID=A0A2G4SXI7_RHIZD|nr:glycoside hydrolase/deacetylase [Rhizopus microsporus ATCC 52813]PHZ13500.1 glycoside hydrolase/deacetylase [Rhizopus microsporus ATCC 52813]